jgi:hypothetical protein
MKTLHLIIPETTAAQAVPGCSTPFALWEVVDQPLLFHWFDHAIDHDYEAVEVQAPDSLRDVIATVLAGATLWPIPIRLADTPGGEASARMVDRLPTDDPAETIALDTVEDLLTWHATLSRRRLDYVWNVLRPDYPFLVEGQGAFIHPDAVLIGPYWIGDNSEVEAGALIGPHTVIGKNVRVRSGVSLEDTHIADGADIAKGLSFDGHTIARGLVFNHRRQILHEAIDPALVRFR